MPPHGSAPLTSAASATPASADPMTVPARTFPVILIGGRKDGRLFLVSDGTTRLSDVGGHYRYRFCEDGKGRAVFGWVAERSRA